MRIFYRCNDAMFSVPSQLLVSTVTQATLLIKHSDDKHQVTDARPQSYRKYRKQRERKIIIKKKLKIQKLKTQNCDDAKSANVSTINNPTAPCS